MDSSSDQKQSALTKQELRIRRLAAFGILQPQNVIVNVTNAVQIDQNSHESQDKKQLKPKKMNRVENSATGFSNNDNGETNDREMKVSSISKKRGHSEIISLLECSSDSEDEIEVGGKVRKVVRPVTSLDFVRKFKVATWNVWFGPQGDGNPHPAVRMRALARLLVEQRSDDCPLLFIGFQEVIDKLAVSLIPALDVAGYRVFRQPGAPYGCAVAVDKRLEIVDHSWHPYSNTKMNRGFYHVRTKLANGLKACPEIVFTTTHLESFTGPDYTGAEQRIPQLQEIERFCNEVISTQKTFDNAKQKETFASIAIMTGDMNWDDERVKISSSMDPTMHTVLSESDAWQDVWRAMPSKEVSKKKAAEASKGYTYDGKLNPMLGGNLRRRFDRCLVRSSLGTKTATNNVVLLGQDPIPDVTWEKLNPYKQTYKTTPTAPSDHFGLVAELEISKP